MKRLLLAIDFSASTPGTVDATVRVCEGATPRIMVLHVGPPEADAFGVQLMRKVVEGDAPPELSDAQESLRAVESDLRSRGFEVESRLVRGDAVESILAEARELRADMIVLGARGRSALYRALVGSVSEGVLRRSDVPVLIVPDRKGSEQT